VKYYEGHEHVYRRLRDDGHACWDKTAFDAFYMRPFLDDALDRIAQPAGSRALDIGCGAGPVTLTLAARGYDAIGVDISPTAIAMAEEHAAARGLHATFRVGDVLGLDEDGAYDLVVDSHCLHCIVFDDERRRALAAVHRALTKSGVFLIETMSRHAAVSFANDPAFVLDGDGVLWRESADEGPSTSSGGDARVIEGRVHQPQRRILAPAQLHAELVDAGFVLDLERVTPNEVAHDPDNYQVIARK
jgi:SAM-dependent methyltransferase